MCERVQLPGGQWAFVCGGHSRKRCKCGRRATLECDWKQPERKSGTCDKGICERCTVSPEPGKDLCPTHAEAYRQWLARKAAR